MIKNIIFDFGDVFINLNKEASKDSLNQYNLKELPTDFTNYCLQYEKGEITTTTFVENAIQLFKQATKKDFIDAWNAILLNFPDHRMTFLKEISSKYNCVLLSNTNELHIEWIRNDWGMEKYNAFKNLFNAFYLSHELGMRKPNLDIYQYVIQKHNFIPNETLFIDDTKENTDAAATLGIKIWNINPKTEDISDLLSSKSSYL